MTTIKNGYGFRVLLTFADESTKTQQHAGFTTKREANAFRDEVIGQLHIGTYIVYGKIRVEEFMIFWLEDIMRPRITDDTYTTYKSAIKNYIVPQIGKMYMSTLNQGHIRKLYNAVAEKYESVAKNVRTIMKTSLEYAFNKNVLATNPAKGINLSKKNYKDLLKSLDLPDIHFHQLRNTYATILLKNSFNSKGVSHLLGDAKEIISVDVYGDTQEIIEDCLDVLEPFIEEVIPKEQKDQYYDYSEVIEIDLILEEYFHAA
nr:site-specific integrase [uncultured Dorea sp.]